MHVVATAGHVDHGKSTLVRQLTGMEPDRWAEERRRGLTIDLGFAWTVLAGGEEIAFVDVPGHERFVPNMLAGIGPVPAVMFVVAADGGWMPQSEEHLSALHAIGVRHGLLVVTRSDLADPEPARAQALQHIAATTLGAVPSVVVNGTTGQGLDALRQALRDLVGRLPAPDPTQDVRLWIDRSFTVSGAGTVVTGTLPAGTLRTDDELILSSTGQRVRVRSLQTLGRAAHEVSAVARVAVNLRGAGRQALRRGDALLTPGGWLRTDLTDVAMAHDAGNLPTNVVLHIGSAAVPARLRPLGDGAVRIALSAPLPLRIGDRVLLRDPGQHRVVGGATVLDVRPPPLRRRGAARARASDLAEMRDAGPEDRMRLQLRQRRFVRGAELRAMGLPLPAEPLVADWHVSPDAAHEVVQQLPKVLQAWQRDHPLDVGMPVDAATRHFALPDTGLVEPLVAAAGLSIGLSVNAGRIQRVGAATLLPPQLEEALAKLVADLGTAPFAAPDANRLGELGLGPRELAAAVRAGRLLKVADGVVLLPGAVEHAARILAGLPQPFTPSRARQALGTTRRVAVPLLELMDRQGFTERLPDSTRRVR